MWTSMNSFSKCRGINCMSPASQQVIMTLEDYIKGQQNKTLLAPENSVVSLPKKQYPLSSIYQQFWNQKKYWICQIYNSCFTRNHYKLYTQNYARHVVCQEQKLIGVSFLSCLGYILGVVVVLHNSNKHNWRENVYLIDKCMHKLLYCKST